MVCSAIVNSRDLEHRQEHVGEPVRLHRFVLVGDSEVRQFLPPAKLDEPIVVDGDVIDRNICRDPERPPFMPEQFTVRLRTKLDDKYPTQWYA